LTLAIAWLAGLGWTESFIASAALTSCSVGMAHGAWKDHPLPDVRAKAFVLQVMVLLELFAIVLLSVETVVLDKGFSWVVPLKLLGIGLTVLLVARFAAHVSRLFQTVLEKTTRWRVHFLVLVVLVICAAGERFGLSAAKTAFILGMFLGRIEHDGKQLEEYIAPVSRGFLIPLFFVALGMQLPWQMLVSWHALLAFGTAGLLIGVRDVLHRRWFKTGGDRNTILLLSPNLTIVALAANAMLQHQTDMAVTSWLLMTGLFMTVMSLFLLPRTANGLPAAAH
jgi:Kef-type K+ transport system membrane component KefB